ncbi:WD repeat domain phosphoinositide-interacting protein 2 [Acipenser ruthenus]|uniref:WD repeat domain phosphoinositide-interacting protein 2 n=1 Tax=Acipenser ruthenus TaxID=7906 RepID=A0A444UEX7_ACIRT|nr:WD repeat domain phosphoinositide-interacting protein 2 [Acipenser ruthenus]
MLVVGISCLTGPTAQARKESNVSEQKQQQSGARRWDAGKLNIDKQYPNPITAEILAGALFVNVVEPMNLASQSGEGGSSQLLFANFNQDNTSLAVGTKSGYKFFSLSSVDKLEQIYECTDTEDVSIVERLFSSSLVAIVSLKAPRKLKVCHFKKGTEICNYSYSNTILAVKLNRQRLIVCLEESLYIHNIRDMKVLHTIRETPPNPSAEQANEN